MPTPENAIPPLLQGPGKLKASFAEFSDDQLRLGLAQLIDSLEGLDELASGVEAVSQLWREVGDRKGRRLEDLRSRL